jgi:hypothetical protein
MTIPRFALRDKATHWLLKRYIYMVKNSARIIFFIGQFVVLLSLVFELTPLIYYNTDSVI